MLQPQTLKFLTQLKKNNNKNWFDAHRAQYEAARIDFSNFIQLVIDALQKTDTSITGLTSKECLFRINRDVRFSKAKKILVQPSVLAEENLFMPPTIFTVPRAIVLSVAACGCQSLSI